MSDIECEDHLGYVAQGETFASILNAVQRKTPAAMQRAAGTNG